MLAFMGFMMVFATIFLLIKGKSNPITVMIIVPIISAFIVGTNLTDLSSFVGAGIETVMNNAVLFIFSIIFFGVMQDLGVFDPMVDWLTEKAGNNVVAITVATAIVGVIAHIDGATATTVLITIPSMYPIYKRFGIKTEVLLAITTIAMGVMNLLPWGGPVARVAAVLGLDANDLWLSLIPVQLFGLVLIIGIAVILGIKEKRRLDALPQATATTEDVEVSSVVQEEGKTKVGEKIDEKHKKLFPFNAFWTIAVIGVLIVNVLPAYLVFMIGLSVAFLVNYPSIKEQNESLGRHASSALMISATMLAAGVMVGIMEGTGMVEAMAGVLTNLIPDALGRFTHVIFGVLSTPLGLMVSTDAYFFGFLPPLAEVGSQFGVAPLSTAIAMLMGKNLSLMISPVVPATYLALGLVEDVEFKDHLKFTIKYVWPATVLMLIFSFATGLIQL